MSIGLEQDSKGDMRHPDMWNSRMVQIPQFDSGEIDWGCTHHWVVCHIIRNARTLAAGTFMELETCLRNRVGIDTCVFDASKVAKCQHCYLRRNNSTLPSSVPDTGHRINEFTDSPCIFAPLLARRSSFH